MIAIPSNSPGTEEPHQGGEVTSKVVPTESGAA